MMRTFLFLILLAAPFFCSWSAALPDTVTVA